MARILLIDDDASLREVVQFILEEAGHEVMSCGDGETGLALVESNPDLVVSDVRMPGLDGMEVLRRIRDRDGPVPPVIMLTAHGTVEQAVTAMQAGAFTYLLKPFARDELKLVVERALRTGSLERENRRLRTLLDDRSRPGGLVYRSRAMGDLVAALERAAPADVTVLLAGESGVGKELAARALHDLSDRWEQPFVAVNCGALPGELLESELFGHAKGAFTGADRARPGRIRAAAGGTLFLDEIGELPTALQPKLLRVLETRQVDPVGGSGPVDVDFRLVCATNRDLEAEVRADRFRADLLYRINVLPLTVPPLRARPEDVPLLWEHFTRLHAGADVETAADLQEALLQRAWPGNVRELKNLNQRLVLLRRGEAMTADDLGRLAPATGGGAHAGPQDAAGNLPLGPLPPDGLSLVALEQEVIRRALALNGGNRSRTAAYLGVPRHVLIYRLNKYGIG